MKTMILINQPFKKVIFLFILGSMGIGCGDKKEIAGDDKGKNNYLQNSDTTSMAGVNEISEDNKSDRWEWLFNGESTEGWRAYGKKSFPSQGWVIENGALKLQKRSDGVPPGGTIIYDKEYGDFELSLEWKISEGGNSGIFYLAEEIEGKGIARSAPEMQILDNEGHPDAKLGKGGNHKAGSLYDIIPAEPQNAKPAGEWNQATIKVHNGTVVHIQNGEKVVEYELWTDDWKRMVENSKFKNWENFLNAGGEDKKGHIGLQDHGDEVWFRNIKIKRL